MIYFLITYCYVAWWFTIFLPVEACSSRELSKSVRIMYISLFVLAPISFPIMLLMGIYLKLSK